MKIDKDPIGQVAEIACIHCGITRHTVRGAFKAYWDDEDSPVSGGSDYLLLECNGCQLGTMKVTSWFSEEDNATVIYWPPRGIREPRDFDRLEYGSSVESVYRQTITAFNDKLPTFAGAGIRPLIEGVCVEHNIIKGRTYTQAGKVVRDRKTGTIILRDNLEGKINGLLTKGHISKNQAKVLHQLRKLETMQHMPSISPQSTSLQRVSVLLSTSLNSSMTSLIC